MIRFGYNGQDFTIPGRVGKDHILRLIARRGTFYELQLLEHLAALVQGPGWAIDCGANIGNHSLFFAKVMGLRTLAFEPMNQTRARLLETVAANGLGEWITVRSEALSDRARQVRLSVPEGGSSGLARIVSDDSGEPATAATLDALLPDDVAPVRLFKIDVEGHEASVARGARALLARDRPVIVAELTSTREYEAFGDAIDGLGYVPLGVFNATPTVIFGQSEIAGEVSARPVMQRLRRYQRRHGTR